MDRCPIAMKSSDGTEDEKFQVLPRGDRFVSYPLIKVMAEQMFSSIFISGQDGMIVPRRAHLCSVPFFNSLFKVALETV